MAGNYAPEYSQQNRQDLVNSYASLLEPQVQKSRRSLASTLAGTPGMWGSPRLAGTGEIESARIGRVGQYAQGLAQQAPQMQREERLLAEQRAYEDPYRQAGLNMQQQQLQDALATSALNRQWYPSQFTGVGPEGQQTLQGSQLQAALTGMYNGRPTPQYQAQMLPYITQGYVNPTSAGFGNWGINTEQQLQTQTPEWQYATQLGFSNPYEMALYAQANPDAFNKLFQGSQARREQQLNLGLNPTVNIPYSSNMPTSMFGVNLPSNMPRLADVLNNIYSVGR